MITPVSFADICAIIITRGDVALDDILATLPYGHILVRYPDHTDIVRGGAIDAEPFTHEDAKVYGRYLAASYTGCPVVYFQDDDVIFTEHQSLLDAFNSRDFEKQWVGNVQPGLDEEQGYHDLALVGCGSLHPNGNWADAFQKYAPQDKEALERFNLDCDFVYGTLSHWKKVDLGLVVLDEASAPNRLWRQEGQMEGKWRSITEARIDRTVALTVLTKNEEANIARALDSALGLFDVLLVHDTGSTDDTKLEISRWCTLHSVPFTIQDREFDNFRDARNALLHEGRQMADYILLMDADEEFVRDNPETTWPPLTLDVHLLHYLGEFDYSQPRLIYSNFPVRFAGKVHAALEWDAEARGVDVQDPKIFHHGDFTHGDGDVYDRIRRDVAVLTEEIEAGVDVPHHLFMRAKAYEGLSEWDKAAADYEARLEFPDADTEGMPAEQHFYARFRLGVILINHQNKFAEGADCLMTAWFNRPKRNESIRALAHYLTVVADSTPYPENEMLFVRRDSYTTNA